MIFLFTDFGSRDIYVGQVKAELARHAPRAPVVDLFHDAPAFDVQAAAHLLAALARRLPAASVTMAVVDPGVGTERRPVVLRADGKHFVGPDNGLLSVLAARASDRCVWEIEWKPAGLSVSFHGRDLFAPIAAGLATGSLPAQALQRRAALEVQLSLTLAQIVYVDHYGNGFTSLPADDVPESALIELGGRRIKHAVVFDAVALGEPFWYANSLGLVEVACNRARAADVLGFAVGEAVAILH